MSADMDYLTQRAIKLHTGRVPGAQQPGTDLSGPATAGGLDYIVLRNLGGVLKRLQRWPKEVE